MSPFNGHIKTAEQRIIIQQYSDWYTGRRCVGCYIWYSEEGLRRAVAPPNPLLAVPNVTAHPSTACVPTSYYSMWHYLPVSDKGLILMINNRPQYHVFNTSESNVTGPVCQTHHMQCLAEPRMFPSLDCKIFDDPHPKTMALSVLVVIEICNALNR